MSWPIGLRAMARQRARLGARPSRIATWLAAGLGLSSSGCSTADDVAADPWVMVGQGLSAYQPLETGDGIELVLGSQGGWHIDLASQFGGTEPDDQFIVYRVWDPEHESQVSYPIKAAVDAAHVMAQPDGSFLQVGIRTVFAIEDPTEVAGRPWLVEAELIVDHQVRVDACLITVVDELP